MNRQRLCTLSVVLSLVCGCSFSEPTALEIAQDHIGRAQWEMALGSSDKLIRAHPANHQGHLLRGRAHLGLNHLEAAIEDLSRAIELAPKEPEAYYQRALAYEYLGKPLLATADLNTAHRWDPNFAITFAYTRVESATAGESEPSDRDSTPIPIAGKNAFGPKAEDGDAQWPSEMLTLLGDDLDQTSTPVTKKHSFAATAGKPKASLDSQDDGLRDGPAVDGHGSLNKTLVSPNDFFQHPHPRFGTGKKMADSLKPHRPANLGIEPFGRASRGPFTFNPNREHLGTDNLPAVGMNRSKYPLARWQAPVMSQRPGGSASPLIGARPGAAGITPFSRTGPLGGNRGSGLGRTPPASAGGKTPAERSKFKPVVVVPHLFPSAGSGPSR